MSVKDRDYMQDGQPAPETPPMSIADSAVAMHEMYLSYLAAGFTDSQAMQIIVGALQASMRH